MSKTKVNVLDCTIRDGSYLIKYQFTAEDTFLVASSLCRAGIDRIEVGHGLGLDAQYKGKGPAAVSDTEYIESAVAAVKGKAKIGVFYIPSIASLDSIRSAADAGLDFIRVGADIEQYEGARESIRLANEYASEHLVLAVEDPEKASKSVENAGAIFLGHYTPVAVGDYIAGPNHVLPTGGTARFFSPLSVEDFLKRTSFVKFEPPKLRELGADVVRLAEIEGLTGHGASVELRLQKIRRARREREAAREIEL